MTNHNGGIMQVIPTRVHGMLDYLVGALLVAAPWLFGFAQGGAETWVPVVLGAAAILYSLFTDYELGAIRRIPMPVHLMLDLASGVLLAISPWLLGFADRVWEPHLIVGLIEIGTAMLTRRVPADGARRHVHATGDDAPAAARR
jgi:SPW repeat-containing protein